MEFFFRAIFRWLWYGSTDFRGGIYWDYDTFICGVEGIVGC